MVCCALFNLPKVLSLAIKLCHESETASCFVLSAILVLQSRLYFKPSVKFIVSLNLKSPTLYSTIVGKIYI